MDKYFSIIFTFFGIIKRIKELKKWLKESNQRYTANESSQIDSIDNEMPILCPHCKSPNLKNIRLCERCGNEIT